jgi:hypothetical protein
MTDTMEELILVLEQDRSVDKKIMSGADMWSAFKSRFTIVREQEADQELPKDVTEGLRWARTISARDLLIDLVKTAAAKNVMESERWGLSGSHSLTWKDITWLHLSQKIFGPCWILQKNFSCEGVILPSLRLFYLKSQGRAQEKSAELLVHWLYRFRDEIHGYINKKRIFTGFNLHFPSPFHTIASGHPALMKLALEGAATNCTGYLEPENAWFDTRLVFPTLVEGLKVNPNNDRPIEPWLETPGFLIKPAYGFNAKEEPFNRTLDLLLLAASMQSDSAIGNEPKAALWIGLTSGKRQLVNEPEVIKILIRYLHKRAPLDRVVIDGWTGSSIQERDKTSTPDRYQSHSSEVTMLEGIVNEISPHIKVRSLVGCSYEEKVREGCKCSFSFTNAFTASLVPSRICSLPGIVHVSNRARGHLRMHVHRKSVFVPAEMIEDQAYDKSLPPTDTCWAINKDQFTEWLERHLDKTEIN